MRELFRLFRESRERAGAAIETSCPPLGFDPNRRSVEVAIAAAGAQRLLRHPLAVEDLTTGVLASLA